MHELKYNESKNSRKGIQSQLCDFIAIEFSSFFLLDSNYYLLFRIIFFVLECILITDLQSVLQNRMYESNNSWIIWDCYYFYHKLELRRAKGSPLFKIKYFHGQWILELYQVELISVLAHFYHTDSEIKLYNINFKKLTS